jgi:hypothetical protein
MGKLDRQKEQAALKIAHKVLADFRAVGIIRDDVSDTQIGMAITDAAQHIEDDVKIADS